MVDIDPHEIAKISPPIDVPVVADVGLVLKDMLAGLRI